MPEILIILISTVLVNNIVLVKFLGLCPLLGVSQQPHHALGMALATSLVLTLTAGITYLLNTYLLIPYHLEFLRLIVFILVIASLVQLLDHIMQALSPLLHQVLGIFLPLITTNCAVLGVALLSTTTPSSLFTALWYGLGTAIGFSMVLIIFAHLRARLTTSDIPRCFQGAPIALMTAGLMSLAFMGFIGMAK